jgi:hypothetical protein
VATTLDADKIRPAHTERSTPQRHAGRTFPDGGIGSVGRTVGGGSGERRPVRRIELVPSLASVESMIRDLGDHGASRPRLQQTACDVSRDIHNSYPQHRGT